MATVAVKVTDLEALKQAVAEFDGATFVEGQRTHKWYGRHVGDYPMPEGMTEDMLGKCNHAIKVNGVNYEVGVVGVNGHFILAYDFYGTSYGGHDGDKLLAKFGTPGKPELGVHRLAQSYAVHAASRACKAQGYTVQQVAGKNGARRIMVTGIR